MTRKRVTSDVNQIKFDFAKKPFPVISSVTEDDEVKELEKSLTRVAKATFQASHDAGKFVDHLNNKVKDGSLTADEATSMEATAIQAMLGVMVNGSINMLSGVGFQRGSEGATALYNMYREGLDNDFARRKQRFIDLVESGEIKTTDAAE